jgi:glycosyltransferase involved in cell wall biosynthesis
VYHGNKVHLEASRDTLVRALQRLSKERQFIFTPIYNIKKLGIWKRFLPRGVNIRHIQWEPETYLSHIAQSDIGVVPNFLPTGPKLLNYWGHKIVENSKIGVRTNINRKDYLNRYKFTSNSGRLYEYALLAKPVVAEPTLSISQDIVHNKDGFLVLTEEGWYSSLKTLIDNPKLRNNLGISFKMNFLAKHSKEHYFEKMQDFLQSIIEPKN